MMRLTISKNNIVLIYYNFFALIVVLLIQFVSERNTWINISFIIYLSSLVINVLYLAHINNGVINFFNIFYVLTWAFHLSQIYLGIGDGNEWDNLFSSYPIELCKKAFTFSYVCIHFMVIGYLFSNEKKITYCNKGIKINQFDRFFIKYAFIFLYVIKILIKINQIRVSSVEGYLGALKENTSFSVMLCTAAEIFSVLYLLHCCKNKNVLCVFLVLMELIFMLTGGRIYSVIYIAMLVLFVLTPDFRKYRDQQKTKVKNNKFLRIIAILVIFVFSIIMVNAVRVLRGSGFVDIFSILSTMNGSNIIYDMCKELGFTQVDTVVAIENIKEIPYLHGSSYINSICTILPNIGGLFSDTIRNFYFIYELQKYRFLNYGGSIVAEAFMNFSYAGCLLFFPIGIFIQKINSKIKNIDLLDMEWQIFIIAICFRLISWTRGYFFAIVRIPIWLVLIYLLFRMFLCRSDKHNSIERT